MIRARNVPPPAPTRTQLHLQGLSRQKVKVNEKVIKIDKVTTFSNRDLLKPLAGHCMMVVTQVSRYVSDYGGTALIVTAHDR